MKILVTGAGGFIGSFIVEKALSAGFDVWAGVRSTSNRKYLQDERIRFETLDLNDEEAMTCLFASAKREFGAWDVVIHAAGITKSRWKHDFFATNYDGTRHLVSALRNADAVPRQFIYLSSLSVYGAVREQAVTPHHADFLSAVEPCSVALDRVVYEPIRENDPMQPNTAYGMSKAAADNYLRSLDNFPWVIFRPTGVYGPRERDYFLLIESIKRHADFAVGYKPQEITFVYVDDLTDAIFAAIRCGVIRRSYLISDGHVYTSQTFGKVAQRVMGVRRVLRATVPLGILRAVCAATELKNKLTGGTSALNTDKYNILKQRNWQCDIDAAVKELDYRPRYDLVRGVSETVAWYIKEQWI